MHTNERLIIDAHFLDFLESVLLLAGQALAVGPKWIGEGVDALIEKLWVSLVLERRLRSRGRVLRA